MAIGEREVAMENGSSALYNCLLLRSPYNTLKSLLRFFNSSQVPGTGKIFIKTGNESTRICIIYFFLIYNIKI